jgi:hypothetical protein
MGYGTLGEIDSPFVTGGALEAMSRENLINHVEMAKCKMLKGLHIGAMTKEHIIEHLTESKCPELKKLLDSK